MARLAPFYRLELGDAGDGAERGAKLGATARKPLGKGSSGV